MGLLVLPIRLSTLESVASVDASSLTTSDELSSSSWSSHEAIASDKCLMVQCENDCLHEAVQADAGAIQETFLTCPILICDCVQFAKMER